MSGLFDRAGRTGLLAGGVCLLVGLGTVGVGPGATTAATGRDGAVEKWMGKLLERGRQVRSLEGRYQLRENSYVWLRKDFGTGDFNGIMARLAVNTHSDRWVQAFCRNRRFFWQARPEFPLGAGGSWRAEQFKVTDFEGGLPGDGKPLPKFIVSELLGMKEIRLGIDPPHVWFFEQLSPSAPIEAKEVKSDVREGDVIKLELSTGVVENKGEIIYRYTIREVKGGGIVWDDSEVLFRVDLKAPPIRLARFEFLGYRVVDGVWIPMESRLTRYGADGKQMGDVISIVFDELKLNQDFGARDFEYEPPFASRVSLADGSTFRVGYEDPSASFGEDRNDRRSVTTRPSR